MPRFQPRLSFSLASLFIAVTLLGLGLGWVGHQWRIVEQRRVVRIWLESRNDSRLHSGAFPLMVFCPEPVELPWIRRMLGDETLTTATVLPESIDEQARIYAAFPEAKIGGWSVESREWKWERPTLNSKQSFP